MGRGGRGGRGEGRGEEIGDIAARERGGGRRGEEGLGHQRGRRRAEVGREREGEEKEEERRDAEDNTEERRNMEEEEKDAAATVASAAAVPREGDEENANGVTPPEEIEGITIGVEGAIRLEEEDGDIREELGRAADPASAATATTTTTTTSSTSSSSKIASGTGQDGGVGDEPPVSCDSAFPLATTLLAWASCLAILAMYRLLPAQPHNGSSGVGGDGNGGGKDIYDHASEV